MAVSPFLFQSLLSEKDKRISFIPNTAHMANNRGLPAHMADNRGLPFLGVFVF